MKTPNRHAANVLGLAIFIGAIALFGLVTVGCALVRFIEGGNTLANEIRPAFVKFAWGANLVVAAMFGMCRPTMFHPLNVPKYQSWLKTTPWHSGKPLPLGPIHLLPVEWALLALWMAMVAYVSGRIPLHLPVVFLGAYLVPMMTDLFKTDEEVIATTLLFGLGGIIRSWSHPIACLLLALGLYALAYLGLRRSLRRFPWPEAEKSSVGDCGWPLQQLGPKRNEIQIGFSNAIVVSLLVAWWGHVALYALTDQNFDPNDIKVMLLTLGFAAVAGLIIGFSRMVIYSNGYASPITFWGRIRTARLIIPTHDNAWIVPLLLPLIGGATMLGFNRLNLSPLYSLPLLFSFLLLLAMQLPPARRQWQLTGEHRLVQLKNRANRNAT